MWDGEIAYTRENNQILEGLDTLICQQKKRIEDFKSLNPLKAQHKKLGVRVRLSSCFLTNHVRI